MSGDIMLPDPAVMSWLRARGAENHALSELESVTGELRADMEHAFGIDLAREMAWEMASQFVPATMVMTELIGQLSAGERADTQGLEITGHFLRSHPEMLVHLRWAVGGLDDPNDQDVFNTLVARALSLTTGG